MLVLYREPLTNMNMKDRSTDSGTKTTDYCALVVFQDTAITATRKPDVTDKKVCRRLAETLPCQEITDWFKSKDRPSLDTDMKISSQTDETELLAQTTRQFIINASRCAIAENRDETHFTSAAANALVTKRCSPMKKVGLLPVTPHPVTKYSTVCSALRN